MKIKKFRAGWSPEERKGTIKIQLEDDSKHGLRFDQSSEFATCLLILQGDGDCYFYEGIISSGIDDI